jgi:hypothetical protein
VSNDTDNTRNDARKPVIYNGDLQALPQAQGVKSLAELNIWSLWRAVEKTDKEGRTKVTKPPMRPDGRYASPSDPDTFTALQTCLDTLAANGGQFSGVGVRLPDWACALDCDGVMEENRPGTLNPWVRAWVDKLRSYCEITPSGTGIRIYVRYTGERLERTKFKIPDGAGYIEIYAKANHFVTVTNNPFPDTIPRITDATDAIRELYAELDRTQPKGKSAEVIDFPTGQKRRGRPTKSQQASNKLESTIRDGNFDEFESRSHAVHYVACELVRRGRSDDEIAKILLDPQNRISEHVRDQTNPPKKALEEAQEARRVVGRARQVVETALQKFVYYAPGNDFIHANTGDHWIGTAVDNNVSRVGVITDSNGEIVKPHTWIMQNREVASLCWAPGMPSVIQDKLMTQGGWYASPGEKTWNLYRPPQIEPVPGDVSMWLDHGIELYGEEAASRIVRYFAHRVQRPGEKPNFALVLGGEPGIGKDTFIHPLSQAVGEWNFRSISPTAILEQWTDYLRNVVLIVNEAADQGDFDRYKLYEHMKAIEAAPPDVLRVNPKYGTQHFVPNVVGVIITTNHRTSALYLPANDRRHEVYFSNRLQAQYSEHHFEPFYAWYAAGGYAAIAHYLATLDLTGYSVKTPPPKTPAFWEMVAMGTPNEDSQLEDALDALGSPNVLTIPMLISAADAKFADWLSDHHKSGRVIRHRLDEAGYSVVMSPWHGRGMWKIGGRKVMVYGKRSVSLPELIKAAQALQDASADKPTSGSLPF